MINWTNLTSFSYFFPADDLPIFPVSFRHLSAVKERVNLAREVDVLDLRARKESNEIGWLEKTAEEMDIMLDEFEAPSALADEDDGGRGSRKQEVASQMKLIKSKKNELSKLLQTPIFPRGFSFKYPTATGELAVPLMGLTTKETAVTVMREALDKESLLKGELLKNYKNKKGKGKPKKKVDDKPEEKGQLKSTKKVGTKPEGKGKLNNGKGSAEKQKQNGTKPVKVAPKKMEGNKKPNNKFKGKKSNGKL